MLRWGLGIEHEVMMIKRQAQLVLGKTIIENTIDVNIDLECLNKTFQKDNLYQVIEPIIFDENLLDILIDLYPSPNTIILLNKYSSRMSILDIRPQQILKKIYQSVNIDQSKYIDIPECISAKPFNKKIHEIVEEIYLKEQILQSHLSQYFQEDIVSCRLGCHFPLKIGKNFVLDYTGSYHINLSLPYSKERLRDEKEIWIKCYNQVEKSINKWTSNQILNIKEVYEKCLKEYPNLKIKQEWTEQMNTLHYKFQEFKRGQYIYKYIYFKYFPKLKKIKFLNTLTNNIPSQEIYFERPYELFPFWNYFFNLNSSKTYELFIFDNSGKLNRVEYWKMPTKFHIDINEYYSYSVKIENSPAQLQKWIYDFQRKTIEYQWSKIIIDIFQPINTRYNQFNKYSANTFHHIHHIFSICLQWLSPLLLSRVSSSDPFHHDLSSRLSLRLAISKHCVWNSSNINEDYIPTRRWIPENIHKYQPFYNQPDIYGYDFRNQGHGFEFGFEYRIFDHFPIEHLENILEYIILLADHLHSHNILQNDKIESPYRHPVLLKQMDLCIKEGYKSKIIIEYQHLITQLFHLPKPNDNIEISEYCNQLYQFLQKKYLGSGAFSKYMINRNYNELRNLANINSESQNLKNYKIV